MIFDHSKFTNLFMSSWCKCTFTRIKYLSFRVHLVSSVMTCTCLIASGERLSGGRVVFGQETWDEMCVALKHKPLFRQSKLLNAFSPGKRWKQFVKLRVPVDDSSECGRPVTLSGCAENSQHATVERPPSGFGSDGLELKEMEVEKQPDGHLLQQTVWSEACGYLIRVLS